MPPAMAQALASLSLGRRSGVCDPDPFSLNPQTECGIHSSVMLAIYILAVERGEKRGGRKEEREGERGISNL